MKKTIKYILIIIFLIAIVTSATLYILNKKKLNNTIYELTYYDESIPGSKYEYIIDKDKIEMTKTDYCSATDCESITSQKENLNYSKENIRKLQEFLAKNFNSSKIEVNATNELTEYQEGVLTGLTLSEKYFEIAIEEYKYKLIYGKDDNTEYITYFKQNNKILVKKIVVNDEYDIEKIDTYQLKFKNKNIRLLYDYIEKQTNEKNKTTIYKNNTKDNEEKNIIASIINNNESYLKS